MQEVHYVATFFSSNVHFQNPLSKRKSFEHKKGLEQQNGKTVPKTGHLKPII